MDIKTELTIEQSAHLIELGVDPKLASKCDPCMKIADGVRGIVKYSNPKPIFILTDILTILPNVIDKIYELNIDATEEYYSVGYICWDEGDNGKAIVQDVKDDYILADELIDSLYQLLCWVIENNYYIPKA